MSLGMSVVEIIGLALIAGILVTNPAGDTAILSGLTNFSGATIGRLEQPQAGR